MTAAPPAVTRPVVDGDLGPQFLGVEFEMPLAGDVARLGPLQLPVASKVIATQLLDSSHALLRIDLRRGGEVLLLSRLIGVAATPLPSGRVVAVAVVTVGPGEAIESPCSSDSAPANNVLGRVTLSDPGPNRRPSEAWRFDPTSESIVQLDAATVTCAIEGMTS